jgi:transcriptional regulator with XRE-family HTH domain
MRRMMLNMSQTKLGDGLGISFQPVQKYEKGTNRIGASRLQHVCQILQIPGGVLLRGSPHVPARPILGSQPPAPDQLTGFMATRPQ